MCMLQQYVNNVVCAFQYIATFMVVLYYLQHDWHYVEVTLDVTVTATGNKLTVTYEVSEPATCTCQLDSGTFVTCKVASFVCY